MRGNILGTRTTSLVITRINTMRARSMRIVFTPAAAPVLAGVFSSPAVARATRRQQRLECPMSFAHSLPAA
jgi:hypothetical protein